MPLVLSKIHRPTPRVIYDFEVYFNLLSKLEFYAIFLFDIVKTCKIIKSALLLNR